jgi:imidazolonepropionase-like amidohydrolase
MNKYYFITLLNKQRLCNYIHFFFAVFVFSQHSFASPDTLLLLKPAQVFDGENMQKGWVVLVKNSKIEFAGKPEDMKKSPDYFVKTIELPGSTLLPGLIEGHSHLFLHPYNETSWDDQVLKESQAERTARAVVHAKKTLEAGFTTVRDLGTEGAGYDDVGLKQAIEKGIIPGPKMIVATRALVATGSYGPKVTHANQEVMQGAEEADGTDNLTKAVRTQIGKGADVIKVYADYRWGLHKDAQPTFLISELQLMVEVAKSSERQVVAHASTAEGMRRAVLAGVATIEHGDSGTPEIFKLMAEKNVALCPTLAAGDAVAEYRGWKKGIDPEPERITQKKKTFRQAMEAGVKICMGGDVGVFSHGNNAREMELMEEYGMKPLDILRSATSVNADVFKIQNQTGRIKAGLCADIVVVDGNPLDNISNIRRVKLVMKDGKFYVRN